MGIDNNENESESSGLRRRANDHLQVQAPEARSPWDDYDRQRLCDELRIHRTELEMQNEELCQARDELKKTLEKYTDLYDFAPVSYFTLDRSGVILTVNLTGAAFFDVERSSLIGLSFEQFVANDMRSDFTVFLEKIFTTQGKASCEVSLVTKGDVSCFVKIIGAAVSSGQECSIALDDITERKLLEGFQAFLAQSNTVTADPSFFKDLARHIADSLSMDYVCIDRLEGDGLSARTVAVWSNGQFEDNVTYALKDTPCGDVVGKTFCCFPSEVRQLFPNDLVLQNLQAESYVGVTLWGHTGKPIGIIAVIGRRPLTNPQLAETMLKLIAIRTAGEMERMDAEEALRRSESLYRAIGESIDYGVWVCAPDGRNIYASDSFLQLVGITQEQCSNFGWGDVLHPDDAERTIAAWKQCVQDCGNWDIEHRFRGVDGRWHSILARGVPVRDDHGSITCWAGINLDISRIKETEKKLRESEESLRQALAAARLAEDELRKTHAELAAANIELEAFNYTVSHDLRRPLSVVHGYCQVLRELCANQLDQQAMGYVREIYESTECMNQMVTALLKFSRVTHAEIRREPVDLGETARLVVAELQLMEPERRVTFKSSAGMTVIGDKGLLRVVLENLIGNAWKFTGTKDESVIEFGMTEIDGKPVCFVRDNGPGFDMAHADKLFLPFHRLPGAEADGHGIGLATVQRIIQRFGGRVWAESKPGEGATFLFTLD